jgi:hypothetical protein
MEAIAFVQELESFKSERLAHRRSGFDVSGRRARRRDKDAAGCAG